MKFLPAVLGILLAFSLPAQRNIFEGFDDNSNEWPVAVNDAGIMSVQNGMYHVSGVNEGYWQHTKTISGGFEDHFRIEVSVARDSATALSKGAGLTWGTKGDSVRMSFLIYGDGHFVFHQQVNGKTQTISPNDILFAVDAEGFNNLRVERNMKTNMYDFSINEQLVLSSPFIAPQSDEVGLYADMAGHFQFDNFWFVERADSLVSHRPHNMVMTPECGEEHLSYTSDFGFSFCVPFGWRADEYKETHCTVWPVGVPYVINLDYTKLAIEDSFGVAARNDYKIFVDSMRFVENMRKEELKRVTSHHKGVEIWGATLTYENMDAGGAFYHARYYVYNSASGGFILVECKVPIWEEMLAMEYLVMAERIARSISFR